ncbi:hypothetical protein BGZ73_007316 [Actinomortierella ambigua]|nr:hypothetical protein BGZ73_007316 [Actinomortierella ambigua]
MPLPVAEAAYVKHGTKFYVYGGRVTLTSTDPTALTGQFFALDLSKPWSADAAVWIKLPEGPKKYHVTMAMSKDGKILMVFPGKDNTAHRYLVENPQWLASRQPFNVAMTDVAPVMTENDGRVVILAGFGTSATHDQIDIYSFDVDFIEATLPVPPYSPSTLFLPAKGFYKAAWSKKLQSIVYYGGLSEFTTDQWVSLYNPVTNSWKSLKTSGVNRHTSLDHCVATGIDNTNQLVDAGRLSSPPMLFSISQRTWVDKYVPSAEYFEEDPPPSPTSPAQPTNSLVTETPSSNIGAIVGGSVGVAVVVLALAGFFLWRRKKQQAANRGEHQPLPTAEKPCTSSPGGGPHTLLTGAAPHDPQAHIGDKYEYIPSPQILLPGPQALTQPPTMYYTSAPYTIQGTPAPIIVHGPVGGHEAMMQRGYSGNSLVTVNTVNGGAGGGGGEMGMMHGVSPVFSDATTTTAATASPTASAWSPTVYTGSPTSSVEYSPNTLVNVQYSPSPYNTTTMTKPINNTTTRIGYPYTTTTTAMMTGPTTCVPGTTMVMHHAPHTPATAIAVAPPDMTELRSPHTPI